MAKESKFIPCVERPSRVLGELGFVTGLGMRWRISRVQRSPSTTHNPAFLLLLLLLFSTFCSTRSRSRKGELRNPGLVKGWVKGRAATSRPSKYPQRVGDASCSSSSFCSSTLFPARRCLKLTATRASSLYRLAGVNWTRTRPQT